MRPILIILTLTATTLSCNRTSRTQEATYDDTLRQQENFDAIEAAPMYKTVQDVVNDTASKGWVKLTDSSSSLSLHFNLDIKDTVSMCYSAECWLMFPYKVTDNKIIVYWDNWIDSKYNFDIVKACDKINKRFLGQPFLVLELSNDTTLKATYLLPDLVQKLNQANPKRIFFPDEFIVQRDFYL